MKKTNDECNSKKTISTDDILEIYPYGESPEPGEMVRKGWEGETDIRIIAKDKCEYSIDGSTIRNLLPRKVNLKVIPVKPGYHGYPSVNTQ